ncbi:unnamed protein product [Dibothriocephalus latus]|uniref:Dynein heavy chain C-terminal domain-containing protein n=1 Tax=Dibothriocephalus latus TaxID=60516 RepID=A0A3P7LGU6_DIBLA|nr:unnamed protein product [Dibothriocephalus latus]
MFTLLQLSTTTTYHEQCRFWLTTEEHPKFPIALLQSSIKFTYDPPMGIRAGLLRTYALLSQDQLEANSLPQWKPMLYGVAFLHSTVQERRKFGPIGWNIPYEFNQADFTSTAQFIQNHLDDLDIPRVQYGGRVTDDYDKRLLNTYAAVWFSEQMFTDTFEFYTGYKIPKGRTIEDFTTKISELPLTDSPQCFGLHPNADITYQTNNSASMLQTIINIQPKDSSGGGTETRESVVYRLAKEMESKLPPDYNPFEVKDRLEKMDYLKPLHIFLRQEIDRMQRVISVVRSTISDLKLAIDGTIIMSENLRDALDNIFDARVPNSWRKGFLTAMRQEIARANKYALDDAVLINDVTRMSSDEVQRGVSEGVYIYGLFLDGAGWDRKNARLMEPQAKVLYTPLPVVHVSAISVTSGERTRPVVTYSCPVYKERRRTDLNYIFPLSLRTTKDPDHWILRGVALLCDVR